MASIPLLKAAGLHSSGNEFSAVPPGGLITATNCVIRTRDVIEPRRGLAPQSYSFGSAGALAHEIWFYKNTAIVHYSAAGAGASGGTVLTRDTGSAYTDYSGTYAPADNTLMRMKFAEAVQSLYFATSAGIYKLDALAGTPALAGLSRPLDIKSTVVSSGGSILANNSRYAYRYTICYKDANKVLVESPPSGRSYVTNTAGAPRDIDITIPVPASGITTSHFYRVYRTIQALGTTVDPGDEMFLVYEKYFTSAQIAAGTLTFTDNRPDALVLDVVPLYTNPLTGQTILQSNDPPPYAKDICYYNDRMWYANTKSKQRLALELLGVGGTGIRLTDTITINGNTFTAASTYSATAPLKWIATSTASSAALQLQDVTTSLCYSINSTALNTSIRAYYTSTGSPPFGSLVLEHQTPGASAFTVSIAASALPAAAANIARAANVVTVTITGTEHGLAVGDVVNFQPTTTADANFPAGSKTVASTPAANSFTYAEVGANAVSTRNYTVTRTTPAPALAWNPDFASSQNSTDDAAKNRVFYSKLQQPEAVPLLNYLDVGSKDYAILRIIPQNDRLFVFKEDGIFVVSGEYPFRVDALDRTVRLLAPDSAVSVNGLVFCITNKGIVAVSQAGAAKVGGPVHDDLVSTFGTNFSSLKLYSYGAAYESDSLYLLWYPTSEVWLPSQAFAVNVETGAFTKWNSDALCARVKPSTDTLYTGKGSNDLGFGSANDNTLRVERKSYTSNDYADESYAMMATTWNATTSQLTVNSTTGIQVGDTVYQDSVPAIGLVSQVTSPTVLTLSTVTGAFAAGAVVAYRPIECTLSWAGQAPEGPAELKHFREVNMHFRRGSFYNAYATLSVDPATSTTNVPLVFSNRALVFPAAGSQAPLANSLASRITPTNKRVFVPAEMQRAAVLYPGFYIKEAFAFWALNGITIEFEPISERSNR